MERKNNLNQEELFFREITPVKPPELVEQKIDAFLYATDFKSEEALLRKFAFGYVISAIGILFFYHQMGAGFLNFNIGSVLNFLGPVLKQLINGICFNTIAVASVLVLSFEKKELTQLLEIKNKSIYGLTFFIWIFLCMFGSEFSWLGALGWIIGASFGAGVGLNFGIKFINEKL